MPKQPEATDGGEALALAAKDDFAVVVTDLWLPDIHGSALIETMAPESPNSTFIIVTGQLGSGLPSSKILDRGVVGVLCKPFDSDELCGLVDRAAEIHDARLAKDVDVARPDRPDVILIVEDNPGDVALLRRQLSSLYTTVSEMLEATRLSEAQEHLASGRVDLVLSDLGLPDARGLDAVRRLQHVAPGVPQPPHRERRALDRLLGGRAGRSTHRDPPLDPP